MPVEESDRTRLAEVGRKFKRVPAKVGVKPANPVFAGKLWPKVTEGSPGYVDAVEVIRAVRDARQLARRGVIVSSAALRDDPEAVVLMENWFGAKGDGEWWQGAHYIIRQLDSALLGQISLYYRNSDVIGEPSDFPGETRTLRKRDTTGYAETVPGDGDLRICLCRDFFETSRTGARVLSTNGYSSAGGVLLHELSHNLCDTEDHRLESGKECYGVADCRLLAEQSPHRAWDNADSIEFFCEQAFYELPTPDTVPRKTVPKPLMSTGGRPVSEVSAQLTSTSPPVEKPPLDLQLPTSVKDRVDKIQEKDAS